MEKATSVSMFESILNLIPEEVNMIGEIDVDKEIENKNYKPYVYLDESRGILKVFRVNKKNLDTLLSVYNYRDIQSPYVSNFEALLYLDRDRDTKAIKALPNELQDRLKKDSFGCVIFNDAAEFKSVLLTIKDKIKWVS